MKQGKGRKGKRLRRVAVGAAAKVLKKKAVAAAAKKVAAAAGGGGALVQGSDGKEMEDDYGEDENYAEMKQGKGRKGKRLRRVAVGAAAKVLKKKAVAAAKKVAAAAGGGGAFVQGSDGKEMEDDYGED